MVFSFKEIMVHYGRSLLSAVQASSKRETEIIWGELKIMNKVRSVLGFWKPGRIWESQKEGEGILVYSGYLLLHNKPPQHSHLKQSYSFLLLMNLQLGQNQCHQLSISIGSGQIVFQDGSLTWLPLAWSSTKAVGYRPHFSPSGFYNGAAWFFHCLKTSF